MMCGLELLSHPLLNCKLAEDRVCPGRLRCTVRPVGNSCGCVSLRETLSLGPAQRCCCISGFYVLELSSIWAYKHQELNFLMICPCPQGRGAQAWVSFASRRRQFPGHQSWQHKRRLRSPGRLEFPSKTDACLLSSWRMLGTACGGGQCTQWLEDRWPDLALELFRVSITPTGTIFSAGDACA